MDDFWEIWNFHWKVGRKKDTSAWKVEHFFPNPKNGEIIFACFENQWNRSIAQIPVLSKATFIEKKDLVKTTFRQKRSFTSASDYISKSGLLSEFNAIQ